MPFTILLSGAKGRMGRAIAAVAAEESIAIGAAVDAGDDPSAAAEGCDAVVDFSAPQATRALLELAVAHRKPIVIGTTGHDTEQLAALRSLAARVPCVWSGNFSVGVNLLFALTARAARVLGTDYDAEIVEMHHRLKKDAPSGTAARLIEIIREERKLGADAVRHGRHGMTGARPSGEIGVHALRGGDVVGDHRIIFAASGESIELAHKASDRAIFARGALRAARWAASRPPGLYDMQDVLDLKRGS
jgi:4-hydroxy-tetrahydrodipicolinate reductase